MDHRVQILIVLIEDDVQNSPSLNELARLVHLSRSRLNHIFRAETGMSIAQYLKAHRMHRARELFETTFLNVKEIMTVVGLTDLSHFVRDFKKAFGVTPSQYKKCHLNPLLMIDKFRHAQPSRPTYSNLGKQTNSSANK